MTKPQTRASSLSRMSYETRADRTPARLLPGDAADAETRHPAPCLESRLSHPVGVWVRKTILFELRRSTAPAFVVCRFRFGSGTDSFKEH